jgi:cyclophilin family peptidyl-prolyl cis-trans isomerase
MRAISFICCFMVLVHVQAQNRFSKDDVLRDIYTLQDKREGAQLLSYLKHKKERYREASALAFASVQDTTAIDALLKVLSKDKSVEVRKAAAYSLGQLYRPALTKSLKIEFEKQKNTDLKNIILEAIGKCASKTDISFFEQLDVKASMHLGYVKGVYYAGRRKVKSDIILEKIKNISLESTDPAILHLCASVLSAPKPEVLAESKTKISISADAARDTLMTIGNPYEQVNFLKKYSLFDEDLYLLALEDYAVPVKTYCMESYLGTAKKMDKERMTQILNSGNVAYVSLMCEKIRKDTLWDNRDSFPIPVLRYVSTHLQLPRDLEAWIDVQKTIAYINGKTYDYKSPKYQRPIDWAHVISIPEMQKVRMTTNKGDVILQCKVNDAPASVSNFLKLVDSGYYDQKYFHRMVPDFVVQGGCPRGDGWGSLDWTQRSEFSNWLRYKPGSVGLASAGKDSEGVQIFITHTFTSNLDGRYTIFAEVVEGMDIVNTLQVGDRILKMERVTP